MTGTVDEAACGPGATPTRAVIEGSSNACNGLFRFALTMAACGVSGLLISRATGSGMQALMTGVLALVLGSRTSTERYTNFDLWLARNRFRSPERWHDPH